MGRLGITAGDAVFAEFDRVEIDTGLDGLVCLVAHVGGGAAPVLVQDAQSLHRGELVALPQALAAASVDQPGGVSQLRTAQ
jgi:hypothetical protein